MSNAPPSKRFDLTPAMAPFMDVHMMLPLLDFVRNLHLYDEKAITKEKIKTLNKTNLIDVIEDEYKKFPNDAVLQAEYKEKQASFDKRRNAVFDQLDNEPELVKKVTEFFGKTELIEQLKSTASNFTVDQLAASHGITAEALDKYYKWGKFKFECGLYEDADAILTNFLSVVQPNSSTVVGACWGQLASRILLARWEASLESLTKVKETIDVRSVAPLDQLRQRAWLLHWGLFVHINQRDGVDALVDFFSEKVYLQTTENLCPWLLRYYTAFVILSPTRRRTMLRDVLNEIQSLSYLYSDPITEFLESLYNQFDFDEAQAKLMLCQVRTPPSRTVVHPFGPLDNPHHPPHSSHPSHQLFSTVETHNRLIPSRRRAT